jgi:hypothetical protein
MTQAAPTPPTGPAAERSTAPKARRTRRRRNRRPDRRVKQAGAGLAVVLGLLASGVGLFDWFEGKVDPPPPPEIDAEITSVAYTGRTETLRQYLGENRIPAAGLEPNQLWEPGLVFLMRVQLKAPRGT